MVDRSARPRGRSNLTAEMTDVKIVLGIREESRPKGHGYLYWRDAKGNEVMLHHCDLHEGSDGRIVEMFEVALVS